MPENLIHHTPSAYDYPLLVKQLLTNALDLYGDQEISYRGELRFSYRELRRRIACLANVLAAQGVGHGDTVAVLDWDSHRYLESYFAIPMMGAVLFTVNVRLSPQQILYCLKDAGAEVALVHADFVPLLEQVRAELPALRTVIVMADGQEVAADSLQPAGEYEALLAAASDDFDFPDFDENTQMGTFYTTGTTGNPKGVYYSHRQLVLHTLGSAASLCAPRDGQRMHREDVYMPITPMFHVLGWGVPYIATMLGLKQVYPGRYLPDVLIDLQQREGVSFSHCVPAILQMLVNEASQRGADLSGWKMIIGGSALSPTLARAAMALGVDVWSGYGMSETGPVAALAQLPPGFEGDEAEEVTLRCRAGRPIVLADVRVVDANLAEVPRDGKTQGEVVMRSPWLTQGYRGNAEASEELWAGGYLHTQDVAVRHPDGYIEIVDRIKDVIKTGGEWVSSLELEKRIAEVAGVAEVAVIAVPDERWGERPLALVVGEAGVQAEAIRQHLLTYVDSDVLSKYAVPEAERIVFVDELPKTSVGKLDKKRMREQHT